MVFIDPKMKALSSLMARSAGLRPSPTACSTCWPCSWRTSRPSRSLRQRPPSRRFAGHAHSERHVRPPASAPSCSCSRCGGWAAGFPSVMGISFTFVSVACSHCGDPGLRALVGAVIVGGLIEGLLGLFARWWRRIITPIVAAVVVTSIGFSLLGVGALLRRRLRRGGFRAAPRTSSSAPSRFWRALCSRASPRAPLNSFRCSSALSWGISWPFRWAKWTSPASLRRSSSRCRACCL